MNFEKSDSQQEFVKKLRIFLKEKVYPYFMEWDKLEEFPRSLFKDFSRGGYLNLLVSKEYEGLGLSYFEYVMLIEEIARIDPSLALSIAAHNSLCSNHIFSFGSQEQKTRFMPLLRAGNALGAWAITELNAGSDVKGMDTEAIKQGSHWVLNGKKTFITHALSAQLYVVIARTGKKEVKDSFTAFILEKGMPGFSSGKKLEKLGMRASETGDLVFEDCKVPDSQRLGEQGDGFRQAMRILDEGRISIAALSLGIAKGAYEMALEYAQKRKQFGSPIAKFQAISSKLAHMATEIAASELLIYKACAKKEKGVPHRLESAMCKYYASEVAVRTAGEALQILGGYGYLRDSIVEKFYRDAKLCTIGEGTSEIQKIVIARDLIKRSF